MFKPKIRKIEKTPLGTRMVEPKYEFVGEFVVQRDSQIIHND